MAREREVVKYHNDLNEMPMRNWTSEEMNLFFAMIMKIRDKGTATIELNTDELKAIVDYQDRLYRWRSTIERFADKALTLKFWERSERKTSVMNLFSRIDIDLDSQTMKVKIADDFEYVVNKITKNFTVYELKEFTQLNSTYSKTMYRLLKQWRTVGSKEFSIEKFRVLLDIPNSYRAHNIQQQVIKPILKELPQYFEGLKVKVIKANTQGTPVKAYRFTWKPEPTGEWDPNKYIETKSHKTSKQKYYRNGMPKPDEREYPDEEIESYYYYAVSKNDNDLGTKEIDNSKIKDNFEDDEPIFGGQLEI